MNNSVIVQNLKCGGCASTIINNISSIPHISDVKVEVQESAITFNALNDEDVSTIIEKLKKLGYPSIEDANSFTSKAKSFVSCATGKISK